MMNKRTRHWKSKALVAALALASCMGVMGISAYFTDADTADNTFTIGKISLDLLEPGWDENNAKNILPAQEIQKDPQVLNDGINEEYVFLEVVIPYVNAQTANEDGTWNAAADVELFSYDLNTKDWVQVGTAAKDATAKTMTYVYAYAKNDTMTALAKDATTPALFEYVRFADLADGQSLQGTESLLKINAYGIQTTNVNDSDSTIDGNNADGKVTPAEVWSVINVKKPALQ